MSDLPTYDEAMKNAAAFAWHADTSEGPAVASARATQSLAWTALARELREAGAVATVVAEMDGRRVRRIPPQTAPTLETP